MRSRWAAAATSCNSNPFDPTISHSIPHSILWNITQFHPFLERATSHKFLVQLSTCVYIYISHVCNHILLYQIIAALFLVTPHSFSFPKGQKERFFKPQNGRWAEKKTASNLTQVYPIISRYIPWYPIISNLIRLYPILFNSIPYVRFDQIHYIRLCPTLSIIEPNRSHSILF